MTGSERVPVDRTLQGPRGLLDSESSGNRDCTTSCRPFHTFDIICQVICRVICTREITILCFFATQGYHYVIYIIFAWLNQRIECHRSGILEIVTITWVALFKSHIVHVVFSSTMTHLPLEGTYTCVAPSFDVHLR